MRLFGLGITLAICDEILSRKDKKDITQWINLAGLVLAIIWTIFEVDKVIKYVKFLFPLY